MEKTKHTPGPWFIVTSDHNVIVDKDPSLDGRIVARTYDNRWQSRSVYDEDGAEGRANARLIAKAPALKAALQDCACSLSTYLENPAASKTLAAARAALEGLD